MVSQIYLFKQWTTKSLYLYVKVPLASTWAHVIQNGAESVHRAMPASVYLILEKIGSIAQGTGQEPLGKE